MALRIADIGDGREDREAPAAALDVAIAAVGATRPHLVDALEATAVAESLGYTPALVRRELGFPDTRAFGEFLFDRLAERPVPYATEEPAQIVLPGAAGAGRAWSINCVVYALFWAAAVALERGAVVARPALTPALMAGLIATGGFAFAMQRRAHFYQALEQPALTHVLSTYVWRIGALATIAATLLSLPLGWAFGLASLPRLVLFADAFAIAAALVLLIAVATARAGSRPARPGASGAIRTLPLPRMTIVLWAMLPHVATMSAAFALIFSERLLTGGAGVTGARAADGLDGAVLAMILALITVERATAGFARGISRATLEPAAAGGPAIGRAAASAHATALVCIAALYGGISTAIAAAGVWMGWLEASLSGVVVPLVAGLPAILALGNARILHTLRWPGMAVATLASGLGTALLAVMVTRYFAAPVGTVLGAAAAIAFFTSTIAVRRALKHADRALLVAG